jgi:Ni,Fe-hydrogenase III small subunit
MKKSLWLFHFGGASCNNCDIEILACLNPRFDVERFGMLLVGSPRHADVILVNGSINKKGRRDFLRYISRLPNPAWWLQ